MFEPGRIVLVSSVPLAEVVRKGLPIRKGIVETFARVGKGRYKVRVVFEDDAQNFIWQGAALCEDKQHWIWESDGFEECWKAAVVKVAAELLKSPQNITETQIGNLLCFIRLSEQ